MKVTIRFLLLIMLVASCNDSVFKLDKTKTGLDLYCFPIDFAQEMIEPNKRVFDKGFHISNDSLILDIVNSWKGKKIKAKAREIPSYTFIITKNGKTLLSCHLNYDLSMAMTGHGLIEISPDFILKYQEQFKPLTGFELSFSSAQRAKTSKELFLKNSCFVPIPGADTVFDWEKYTNKIQLKRENIRIKIGEDLRKIDQQLKEELDAVYNDFEIKEMETTDKNDSILISIQTNLSADSLPDYYRLVDKSEMSDSIKFEVFGVDSLYFKQICDKEKITFDKVRVVNY